MQNRTSLRYRPAAYIYAAFMIAPNDPVTAIDELGDTPTGDYDEAQMGNMVAVGTANGQVVGVRLAVRAARAPPCGPPGPPGIRR